MGQLLVQFIFSVLLLYAVLLDVLLLTLLLLLADEVVSEFTSEFVLYFLQDYSEYEGVDSGGLFYCGVEYVFHEGRVVPAVQIFMEVLLDLSRS